MQQADLHLEQDDLLLLDAALVQPEQAVGARESGDNRDAVPVEMKLDDGCLSLGRSGSYSARALADVGLVHKTISWPSRWAFFKGLPGSPFPGTHRIIIALDGALLGLLRAEAQRTQDAPDLRLAKAHALHPFDDDIHAFERTQLVL